MIREKKLKGEKNLLILPFFVCWPESVSIGMRPSGDELWMTGDTTAESL